MAIVTHTIGTNARDFSTIQAWINSLPANLVTDGNSQVGECFNDSEFSVAGTVATFSGHTTDATHTITLQCHAGQSFKDNAGVQSNALNYNQANGVGLRCTVGSANGAIRIADDWVFLNGLQVRNDGTFSAGGALTMNTRANGPFVSQCIFVNTDANAQSNVVQYDVSVGGSSFLINSIVIQLGTNYTESGIQVSQGSGTYANVTVVGTQANGFRTGGSIYGAMSIKNCAVFGFTNFISGTAVSGAGVLTGANNGTDLVSVGFGSSNQVSLTAANQFQTATFSLAAGDFRLKAGAALIDTGVTDTTDIAAANDIAGTSRPQGSAWDIGAWELVQAAATARASTMAMMGVG